MKIREYGNESAAPIPHGNESTALIPHWNKSMNVLANMMQQLSSYQFQISKFVKYQVIYEL